MKCATLLLMTAGACQAFVTPSNSRPTATALQAAPANVKKESDSKLTPVYPENTKHDPHHQGPVGGTTSSKGLQQIFPDFTKPDPKGPLGAIGTTSSKGLQKIFPDFMKPDPSAALGEVGDVEYDKHKLTPVFPEFTKPDPKGKLGEVGDGSDKRGLNPMFPTW